MTLYSPARYGKKPSLGVVVPTHPHERNFFAPKDEDRNQEDTLEKKRMTRAFAWNVSKRVHNLKDKLCDILLTI